MSLKLPVGAGWVATLGIAPVLIVGALLIVLAVLLPWARGSIKLGPTGLEIDLGGCPERLEQKDS
jgi:hypothetical protein